MAFVFKSFNISFDMILKGYKIFIKMLNCIYFLHFIFFEMSKIVNDFQEGLLRYNDHFKYSMA